MIILKKIKNRIWIVGFLLENREEKKKMILPIKFINTNNFDVIPKNYFLLKLNPLAIITYIFDSPIEMLYYYQLNSLKIKAHQFISFIDTITKEEISQIIDLAKGTKIHTVFSKKEIYGNINDIRFALASKKTPYLIYKVRNGIKVIVNDDTYIMNDSEIVLHKFEKISKKRHSIKTIKPPKGFQTFKEIIHP